MPDLNIQLTFDKNQTVYRPGDKVRGNVSITSPGGPTEVKSAELLLYWNTSGVGDKDENVVETVVLVQPDKPLPSAFSRAFELALPLVPWSYAGTLIKIHWFVGVFVRQSWRSSSNLEMPIEVRPDIRADKKTEVPDSGLPEQVEIFYDKHGRPIPRPLNI